MHLSEKQKEFESSTDYRIQKGLPIIIKVDGTNFSKITRRLQKPYDLTLSGIMASTMINVAKLIEGTVFAFTQSDEICFILRNDQDGSTWLNGRVQSIATSTCSYVTYYFNNHSADLNLSGPGIFRAHVFPVPSLEDAADYIANRQSECLRAAINECLHSVLLKSYDRKEVAEILDGKSMNDRLLLLSREGINFDDYHQVYKFGVSCYKQWREVGETRHLKWVMDDDLPRMTEVECVLPILEAGRPNI